ncbi:PIN domain-containing protein [Sphingopyxis lindanitolerans]|uniref:PIN domain-containing protein n=2 Tax=Sphingopyxis TaxID=165697 RepID=A0A246JNQ0_9SPHN|nr:MULTISPECIES: PIN domain-containing protein [Sphingopyxis]OWQ94274.1 PIN domain-containing protein [Sphingopyxis witflariensis]PQM28446.1 PIN domain-containing protein [Sphingopyxis lindanitolerans]
MRCIADRFVVVLDANVLYPFRVRDAPLRFAEAGLFRARWSPTILDEWRRNLLGQKPGYEASIDAQITAMRIAFPEGCVTGGADLIDSLDLPDADDRHVLATAIRAGAEHIVTENLKDFPDVKLKGYGISAVSADDFLASTFELYPTEALSALATMRRCCARPPFTPSEFIFDLQKKGLPKLASMLRENIDLL